MRSLTLSVRFSLNRALEARRQQTGSCPTRPCEPPHDAFDVQMMCVLFANPGDRFCTQSRLASQQSRNIPTRHHADRSPPAAREAQSSAMKHHRLFFSSWEIPEIVPFLHQQNKHIPTCSSMRTENNDPGSLDPILWNGSCWSKTHGLLPIHTTKGTRYITHLGCRNTSHMHPMRAM